MATQTDCQSLRVGLAVSNPCLAEPDTLRLVEILDTMKLVDLVCIIKSRTEVPPKSRPISWWLTLEATLTNAKPKKKPIPNAADREVLPAEAGALPDLDLILDHSGGADVEALAGAARHGIWRLSTVSPESGIGAAMTAEPASAVRVWCLTLAQKEWRLLAETAFDTKFLATRNQLFQREKALSFVEGQLARLALGEIHEPPDRPAPELSVEAPTFLSLPGYLKRVTSKTMHRGADKLRSRTGGRPGRFCLRLSQGTALDFDPVSGTEFDAPAGTYWADPFLIAHQGDVYVFFEVFDYRTGRGHIGVGRLEGDRLDFLGVALKTPYHLSYPFVFRHGDEIFMLPETHATERLEIWRATDFPLEWTLHRTAMEGTRASDSTLAEIDGQWWLFTNLCRDRFNDFCSELHLFQLGGPDLERITPHALNPVVVGSRTARGGGRIFREGGRLFRPSQDNSHGTYGYGLNIMEIEALDLTSYRERLVRRITPRQVPSIRGIHHFDSLDGRVVFDVRKH